MSKRRLGERVAFAALFILVVALSTASLIFADSAATNLAAGLQSPEAIIYNNTLSRNLILSALCLSAVLAIIIGWRFVKQNWQNSIVRLSEQLKRASTGEKSEISLDEGQHDPLTLLAKSINQLTGDLLNTKSSRNYIANILQAMADMLIVLNPDGSIRTVNSATLQLLKYEEKDLLGKKCEILFDSSPDVKLLTKGTLHGSEMKFVTKTGKVIPVSLSSSTTTDDSGKACYVVIVAQNITERQHFQEMLKMQAWELAQKNDELKRLNDLKSDFISTVSHELRTPLAVMKGAISNMERGILGELNEEQIEAVGMTHSNIKRLTRLINDLLDLSRLESGKTELHPNEVPTEKLVEQTVKNFQMMAQNKQIKIEIALPRNLPHLYVDEDMTTQVLTNLMDNALRYAKNRVSIEVASVDNAIEFRIGDDGIGIESKDAMRLFNKFEQVNRSKGGSGYKGTGLGLAICKEIVESHAGKIWVESQPGLGATFHFTLPQYGGYAKDFKQSASTPAFEPTALTLQLEKPN